LLSAAIVLTHVLSDPLDRAYTFSEDEEEDVKRVVRSAKEKRFEELQNLIKQARNHKKNKDLAKVLAGFEEISRAYIKAKTVIEKEGDRSVPRLYVRYLTELDDFTTELWEDKEGKKNLSKNNSKSLGILRQKLRKYIKDFEKDINLYRVSPDTGKDGDDSESAESGSDSDSDEEGPSRFQKAAADSSDSEAEKPAKSKFLKGTASDEDDESESDWGSDSEESSASSDDEGTDLRSKFLKQETSKEPSKEVTRKKKKEKEQRKEKDEEEKEDDEGAWEKVGAGISTAAKPKLFNKTDELSHDEVLQKIYEISAMRGKKKIRKSEQIRMFNEILTICGKQNLGSAMEIKVLYGIITSLFDYNPNAQTCIRTSLYIRCLRYIITLIDKLCSNPEINIGEHIPEEKEQFAEAPYQIHGCILSLIERMDVEFTKLLQSADPHTPEYVDRLKFERIITKIITRFQLYLEENSRGTTSELCRAYLLRIDHLYYKFDRNLLIPQEKKDNDSLGEDFEKVELSVESPPASAALADEEKAAEPKADEEAESAEDAAAKSKKTQADKFKDLQIEVAETSENGFELMNRLCKYIYTNDTTDRIRTQAILMHIYHHALHDNWYEARDLMLISQLQSSIQKADIPLQIIYNRALVQIGLCAFRHGFIKEAHNDLLDIHLFGRAKELLAQGLLPKPPMHERTPEQEKLEKQRLLPFHKQINLELLECVYLVSAMLLEIPDVAANEFNVKKKMITRPFYNQLRKNEEQPLVGLPESMREHVIAASKAMKIGNWKQCREFIINDKMNAKVWNLFHQPEIVREMLVRKIKEESLRSYIFTYSHIYDSISLDTLSNMFELEMVNVHSIVAKMIINEELMASLDEPTHSLTMHRTEPSRIQSLSLQLAEKINLLLDHNEKLYELKQIGQQGGRQTGRKFYDDDKKNRGDRSYMKNMRNNKPRNNNGRGGGQQGRKGPYQRSQHHKHSTNASAGDN
jgi:translation initiation factor 3 subunit C